MSQVGRVNRRLRLFDAGAAKQLSILLEGESLLNDGAAIILYHVFNWMAKDDLNGQYYCVVILVIFHLKNCFPVGKFILFYLHVCIYLFIRHGYLQRLYSDNENNYIFG